MIHFRSTPPTIALVGVTLVAVVFVIGLAPANVAAQPPNVVVFLADDAGCGDYGFAGNKLAQTPNIDSIARAGVSLDRFFVCPVCSPTRAEFLTGRYHPRGGVRGVSTGQERLNLDERTIAEAFKAAGYATGCFGKWHNGSQWPYHPMARGFDTYFGHSSGHWGEYFDAPLEENGQMVRTQGYIVDVCTDKALQFIDKQQTKPFFCYIPFTTPHSPWAAPESDWKKFRSAPITQTATNPENEKIDETRCALAMLANQDQNVGKVLRKLDQLQLADNTIVVYFSDNGPNTFRWTEGLRGRKGTTDEGGVRSVCYLRWPRQLPHGHRVTEIAGAIDLLPTLTAMAGIEPVGNRPLDGNDLSTLLMNQPVDWPKRKLFSTWANRISVRTDRFRLDDRGRLYDMRNDPGQTKPVNEEFPAQAADLIASVEQWRREVLSVASEGLTEPLQGNDVDPRPIPVGYVEFPITMLPARDGVPRGGLKRSAAAPNCSYFVDWSTTNAKAQWNIEITTSGIYEVAIDYTAPKEAIGSELELTFNDSSLSAVLEAAWDPPLLTNQDTLPRPPVESQMKEFRTWKMGTVKLAAGKGKLQLQATHLPSDRCLDLRRITLTLIDPHQP